MRIQDSPITVQPVGLLSRFHFVPGYLPVSVNLMDFLQTQIEKIFNNFTFEIDYLTLRLPQQHAQPCLNLTIRFNVNMLMFTQLNTLSVRF